MRAVRLPSMYAMPPTWGWTSSILPSERRIQLIKLSPIVTCLQKATPSVKSKARHHQSYQRYLLWLGMTSPFAVHSCKYSGSEVDHNASVHTANAAVILSLCQFDIVSTYMLLTNELISMT